METGNRVSRETARLQETAAKLNVIRQALCDAREAELPDWRDVTLHCLENALESVKESLSSFEAGKGPDEFRPDPWQDKHGGQDNLYDILEPTLRVLENFAGLFDEAWPDDAVRIWDLTSVLKTLSEHAQTTLLAVIEVIERDIGEIIIARNCQKKIMAARIHGGKIEPPGPEDCPLNIEAYRQGLEDGIKTRNGVNHDRES